MNYQQLKDQFGTPLYIYDEDIIRRAILGFKNNFHSNSFQTEIIYASKAFNIKAMLKLINEEGLSLDVVSLGELYTAYKVGFPLKKVYFHGNNKSYEELEFAVKNDVGTIVVDHLDELKLLDNLVSKYPKVIDIMLRLNVGVEAHTHKYIATSHIDSKFGIAYNCADYQEMLKLIASNEYLNFIGFHAHIGSQIFDLEGYYLEIEKLVTICKEFNYPLVLNLGGGFGARYTDADKPLSHELISQKLILKVEDELIKQDVKIAKLCIEPGRSIVATAGKTLYTIGGIKKTPNKLYYFVDGGMTDNIRPALYDAIYEAQIVGKEKMPKNIIATIAGKACESGDILIENAVMPMAQVGDLLVVSSTGAYGYSMSSNYNKALIPAVVFVSNKEARLVVRRQSLEELLEREN